jgi:hypothetical protein
MCITMNYQTFFNKFRQWDNRSQIWFSKNFSMLLFEIILVAIFIIFLNNTFDIIGLSTAVPKDNLLDKILLAQSGLILLVIVLMLFNAFIMLFMFNSMLRLRSILKNIDFNLSRRGSDRRSDDN